MSHPSSFLSSVGLALLLLSSTNAITLDGLTSNSPFVAQSAVGVPTANPETASLEFRGVIASRDGTVFGFYDRARNQGGWVRQNEAGAEFNVLAYDAANAVVTVDYQGKKLSLALSAAKIETVAPSAIPLAIAAPLGAPAAPTIAAANPNDQRKLEAIAAEVRRRRALRQSPPAVTPHHQ
jgi:hypothetical protein